jgi:hypothetical protein
MYGYNGPTGRWIDRATGHFISKSRGRKSSIARKEFAEYQKKVKAEKQKKKRKVKKPLTDFSEYLRKTLQKYAGQLDFQGFFSPGSPTIESKLSTYKSRLKIVDPKNLFAYSSPKEKIYPAAYPIIDQMTQKHIAREYIVVYLVNTEEGLGMRDFLIHTNIAPENVKTEQYFAKPLEEKIIPALDTQYNTETELVEILFWAVSDRGIRQINHSRISKKRLKSRKKRGD